MSARRELYYLEDSRAFRVAWVMEELSLDYTLRLYRRVQGKRAEPALRAESANPLGKSPYLIDGDVRLGESGALVKYLVQRYGAQRGGSSLLGTLDAEANWQERADIEAWISFSEGMMTHTLAAIYPRWFTDANTAAQIEKAMSANIHNNLNLLESSLAQNDFLMGKHLTAADICCVFSAEYTLGMDTAISSQGKRNEDWPNTLAWLKRCAALPSYQRVLQKGAIHRFTLTS